MFLVFILIGVTQTPDGPFKRPHPGKICYQLLIYVLYYYVKIKETEVRSIYILHRLLVVTPLFTHTASSAHTHVH